MNASEKKSPRRVAFIPARGGSKRLPGKNIAPFLGKPIIAWSIDAARETGLFERIIVSTDDAEIAAVAKKYGAEIDNRPPEMATDHVNVTQVCLDYLRRNPEWDIFCCLYATAPLRSAEDIKNTIALLEPGICHVSAAMTHYGLPVHQALWKNKDGSLRPVLPELVEKQSNDVSEIVVDNGSTYAALVPQFLATKTFFESTLRGHVMPRERSQDIDEAVDFELAEFFARKLKATA